MKYLINNHLGGLNVELVLTEKLLLKRSFQATSQYYKLNIIYFNGICSGIEDLPDTVLKKWLKIRKQTLVNILQGKVED